MKTLKINKKSLLWQPHDFRIYYDFSKKGFKHKKPSDAVLREIKNGVPRFNPAYTYSSKNYGKEHLYKDFMACTIEVKKEQIVVHNRSHAKQWRHIQADKPSQVKARIDEIMKRLTDEAKHALQIFLKIHGGQSKCKELKKRCEHGIHGDEFLDKIPSHLVINDTVFKKVYDQKVEFTDATAMKTYINNRAIEDVAPEIAKSINDLGSLIKRKEAVDFLDYLFDNNLHNWFNDLSKDAKDCFIAEFVAARSVFA